MSGPFHPDRFVVTTLLRTLPGLVAIGAAATDHILGAGLGLVLAVWADVITGAVAHRHGWLKTSSVIETESLVDFVCFIWLPAQFVLAQTNHYATLICLIVFIIAGIFRLARFKVEGLRRGRYRGLPVTYNGYVFPLAGIVSHYSDNHATAVFVVTLLSVAALMVSRKLMIPEAR